MVVTRGLRWPIQLRYPKGSGYRIPSLLYLRNKPRSMIESFYNLPDLQVGFAIWLFVWMYLQITPLQMYLDDLYDNLIYSDRIPGLIMQFISLLYIAIDCHKCLSFWLILILTGNPIIAISFSILASLMPSKTK